MRAVGRSSWFRSVSPRGLQDLCDHRTLSRDLAWLTVAASVGGHRPHGLMAPRGQGDRRRQRGSAGSGFFVQPRPLPAP